MSRLVAGRWGETEGRKQPPYFPALEKVGRIPVVP